MNYPVLIAELSGDPLARGYAAMSDAEVVTSLNTANRTRIRTSMSGDEVFQQTDKAEFAALTDVKKQLWMAFTGRDIDPSATPNVDFVKYIFGDAGATVVNLASTRQETVSRAKELGLGEVKAGHIQIARA